MNLDEYLVFRDTPAHVVKRYLMPHENHTIAVRRHLAVLLRPLAEVFGGLILCGFVSGYVGIAWIWWLWPVTLLRLVWHVYAWSEDFFVVTEYRVMVID